MPQPSEPILLSEPLRIDPATGLVRSLRQVLSPHCDLRPAGLQPELIVIHGISLPPGQYGGGWIERLFCSNLPPDAHPYFAPIAALRVSAHALIRRDGTTLQFAPFHLRAWHAGASSWQGRSGCNDYSIGIELEGTDETPYEEAQYVALVRLVRVLLATYPALGHDRIVGHDQIAPGRKTDPGVFFDWARLRAMMTV